MGVRGPFLQFFSKLIVMRICAQWVGILQTGASDLELCLHNLTFNTFEYLFFLKYLPRIESTYNENTKSHYISVNTFKMYAKSIVFDLQSQRKEDEWEGHNIPLHCVPGLPRGSRMNIPPKKYSE